MMLIAIMPCSFDGHNFFPGEVVPEEYVLDPKRQESLGVLAIAESDAPEAKTGTIALTVDGTSFDADSICDAMRILHAPTKDAVAALSGVENKAVLDAVEYCEHRKQVLEAVVARREQLNAPEAGEEQ